MDENCLLATARYIEQNPVKAGLVNTPGDYPWSSARHYLGLCNDPLLGNSPLPELVPDWKEFLNAEPDEIQEEGIRRAERSGRPLGTEASLAKLEKQFNRRFQKNKPGPKGRIK